MVVAFMLKHNSKLRVCYICGREFGSHSIGIHEPKCLEKWHIENDKLPTSKRRNPPIKPQVHPNLDHNRINDAAYQSAKSQLIPCRNCGRTFYPDRVGVHERKCNLTKLPPILSIERAETRILSSPKVIHESNRVDIAASPLPRSNTVIKKSTNSRVLVKKAEVQIKSRAMNNSKGYGRSGPRKPQLVVCYICGREFTGASLPIHEPQCLEKWKMENSRLPRELRRPLPKKPQAIGGGKASMEAMNQAAAEAARGNLVPCRGCGRKFATDRIEVHERICLKGGGDGGSNKATPVSSGGLPTHSGDNRNSTEKNGMSKSGGQVRKSRQPKFVFCYICGRQFTDASLPIHEPQCLEKWEMQNNLLPREQRRPRPKKPEALKAGTANMTREEIQEVQWEAAQANRVPCKRCGRRFNPDRVAVHERSCKASGAATIEEDDHSPARGVGRGGQGKRSEFEREGEGSPRTNRTSRVGRVPGQKPVSVICYLCGRDFGTKSIEIHQPQCLQKWHIENDKLPRHQRRPEPKKPQNIPISGTGAYDLSAANDAAFQTAMESRVACENCGRKFNPDRIAVHQRSCRPK